MVLIFECAHLCQNHLLLLVWKQPEWSKAMTRRSTSCYIGVFFLMFVWDLPTSYYGESLRMCKICNLISSTVRQVNEI